MVSRTSHWFRVPAEALEESRVEEEKRVLD